jgi:hypothetical protein
LGHRLASEPLSQLNFKVHLRQIEDEYCNKARLFSDLLEPVKRL